MKLYYTPGACAMSVHIALCELGLPHEAVAVDLKSHTYDGGKDYYQVNPKGYVPALQLDDGQVLTELPAIMQYLAELKPEANLLPASGIERARAVGWFTFIGMELHRNCTPFFRPGTSDDWKQAARAQLERRLSYVNEELANREYLVGNQFTLPDAYLFTVLNWMKHVGLDLASWPNVAAFRARVAARPKVQEAMRAEGLPVGD